MKEQQHILVPESRELDLFASMLERKGALTRRCPLVQIVDLPDTRDARQWIQQLIAGAFHEVIWMTGEGLHRLAHVADQLGQREAFVEALKHCRAITRGPKPARALRELGLPKPWLAAPEPTSHGVLAALADEDLTDRPLGLQLYPGDGGLPLLQSLRNRGAQVFPVTPYAYASESDTGEVIKVIHELLDGQLGMIAFTSSAQLKRLLDVAREAGLFDRLMPLLREMPMAAIGPVIEALLREQGFQHILRPETSFHLKPLVKLICDSGIEGLINPPNPISD